MRLIFNIKKIDISTNEILDEGLKTSINLYYGKLIYYVYIPAISEFINYRKYKTGFVVHGLKRLTYKNEKFKYYFNGKMIYSFNIYNINNQNNIILNDNSYYT